MEVVSWKGFLFVGYEKHAVHTQMEPHTAARVWDDALLPANTAVAFLPSTVSEIIL